MDFTRVRFFWLLLTLAWASAADLPLTEGFRTLPWGTPRAEITATWPKPLGQVDLDGVRSIYVIDAKFGLILAHDRLRGVVAGGVLATSVADVLGIKLLSAAKQVNDTLTLGMTYHAYCSALALPEGQPIFRHEDRLGKLKLSSWFHYEQRHDPEHYVLGGFILVDPQFMMPDAP